MFNNDLLADIFKINTDSCLAYIELAINAFCLSQLNKFKKYFMFSILKNIIF